MPLGRVQGGVLYPVVAVQSLNQRGMARVLCPTCGRVRLWFPSAAAAAAAGDRRPADRPG